MKIDLLKNNIIQMFSRTNIVNFNNFVKKYRGFINMFMALVIIILLASTGILIESRSDNMYNLMNDNMYEYNEVDLDHLCKLSDCETVYFDNKKYIRKDKTLSFVNSVKYNPLQIEDHLFIIDNNLVLYNENAKAYFSMKYFKYISEEIQEIFYIFVIVIILFVIFMYKLYKRERQESLIQNIGNEAILANKSMVMITENVHHELNTPVEVIENKIEKIHRILNGYILSEQENMAKYNREVTDEKRKWNKKIILLEKDFEFVKLSIEQINTILAKMKNFKTIRYSNGDKTLYDVVLASFRILNVSNTDFSYSLDNNLKNYRLVSNGLKNVDLLNVLINHIKNSLEANSTFINVSFMIDAKMHLYIKDNGSGIKEEAMANVFEPNLSSKQIGHSIRGNGMYLNKHIIQEFGGDIQVKESSNEGTIIDVSFYVRGREAKASDYI